jgi:ribosomal protein S18 acetylase RimI-like enzyme
MTSDYDVVVADATRLDDVGPLFRGMVEHHRLVAGEDWPVREAGAAWDRRRRQYADWLSGDRAWLLLAVSQAAPQEPAAGYAMVRLTEPGPSWDLGEVAGELESLAVADYARGAGIGTRLMDAARDLLRAQGARYWSVGVVEANTGAVRLYERSGFRPYYRELLGRL